MKAAAPAAGWKDERARRMTVMRAEHPKGRRRRSRGIHRLLEHCCKRIDVLRRRRGGRRIWKRILRKRRSGKRALDARPAEGEERGWSRPMRNGGACLRHKIAP